MEVINILKQSITGVVDVLSAPIPLLYNLSLVQLSITVAVVGLVIKFIVSPIIVGHKQFSATERKKK